MNLACCIWALSGSEDDLLTQTAGIGFDWIDVQPFTFTAEGARAKISQLGLRVSCVGVSFGLPDGAALDSPAEQARTVALAHVERALAYGAEFGATVAYVVPGHDDSAATLDHYAQSLATAADVAAGLDLKLCIEHFPGRALPTASGTLNFLRQIGHPNLYLLFDIGHIQLSGEDPAAVITEAGPLLGYVHLDDNDGQGDLHWSLLDGLLTKATLTRTLAALDEIGYQGAVSLELSANLPDPLASLKQSREIVVELAGF